jgi:hypothetical protein
MEKINRKQIEKLMKESNVFCILPFKHILLQPRGTATLCCMNPDAIAKDNKPILWEEVDFEKDLWQGKTYQRIRTNMLNDAKSYECRKCYEMEDTGSKSYRNGQNFFELNHPEINNINIESGNDFKQPVDWDIRLSRLCNLMCRMCNQDESSQIAKEAENNPNVIPDYKPRPDFNYDEKDATYILEALPNMKRLKILGGEPTLDPQVQRILDEAIRIGRTDLRLDITSNLTNVTDKWLNSLGRFNEVQLQFSIDGVGKTNEYIRWPSKWAQVEENIEKYLTFKAKTDTRWFLSFHQTISIYNIFDFWKVHEWVESLRTKDKYNRVEKITPWHTYILHSPNDLNPRNILTTKNKQEILKEFNVYRPNINDKNGFIGIQSIITLLEDPYPFPSEVKTCKHRTDVIDKIRNAYVKDYIPAVATVLNSG